MSVIFVNQANTILSVFFPPTRVSEMLFKGNITSLPLLSIGR